MSGEYTSDGLGCMATWPVEASREGNCVSCGSYGMNGFVGVISKKNEILQIEYACAPCQTMLRYALGNDEKARELLMHAWGAIPYTFDGRLQ